MQPDRFTIKSQEAVQVAQRLASANLNPDVAPLRERVQGRIEQLPRLSAGAEVDARPSSAFVKALQRAEREAARQGGQMISTQHILLALADPDSGVADLLPDPGTLAKASDEVAGSEPVTSPN